MTVVDHVIVFGDSLSDIGRKWGQAMGGIAARLGDDDVRGTQMLSVNATGRFSDSKNWTDYMFEDSSGKSLISASSGDSIRASKEHHRLSSKWISPTGGHRFRYANYAVGGAVGWEEKSFQKWVGLTRFSDQVNEFEKDFAALSLESGVPHRFLFIVMFGANDIYTDEKASNRSTEIGNGIKNQCIRAATIVNRRLSMPSEFIVAGVGLPAQSFFYNAQENDKKMAVQTAHRNCQRAYSRNMGGGPDVRLAADRAFVKAQKSLEDWQQKCRNLHQQVDTLNSFLSSECLANAHWRFFPLSEALTFVETNASALGINHKAAQTLAQYELISHKRQGNHFSDPDDPRLEMSTGHHALFTADQKHPTSRGYQSLWTRMQELLEKEDLTFGILAGPQARQAVSSFFGEAKWQKDSEVHTCHECHTKFGVFTRKHHCRNCGNIFCNKCTTKRITMSNPLTEKGTPAVGEVKDCRVCNVCHELLSKRKANRDYNASRGPGPGDFELRRG
jgi:hypothetical protein